MLGSLVLRGSKNCYNALDMTIVAVRKECRTYRSLVYASLSDRSSKARAHEASCPKERLNRKFHDWKRVIMLEGDAGDPSRML